MVTPLRKVLHKTLIPVKVQQLIFSEVQGYFCVRVIFVDFSMSVLYTDVKISPSPSMRQPKNRTFDFVERVMRGNLPKAENMKPSRSLEKFGERSIIASSVE